MQGELYRIVSTTIAYRSMHGLRITEQVPIGTLVILINGSLNGDRLVDVMWRDQKFMMFTQDLRQRAEPVAPTLECQP